MTYAKEQLRIRLWRQALGGRRDRAPCDGCGRRSPAAYLVTLETPAQDIWEFTVCVACAPAGHRMAAARTWADVVALPAPSPQPDPDLSGLVG